MTDDIVAQLWRVYGRGDKDAIRLASYAAEEIERLRAELAAERERAGIITQAAQGLTNDLRAELAAAKRDLTEAAIFEARLRSLLREARDMLGGCDGSPMMRLRARIDAALNKGGGDE